MATANQVLSIAAKEIGYTAGGDPQTGTKYGRWYADITRSPYFGQTGVPYCAMFVAWCLNQAGQSAPGMPTAAVQTAYNAARNAGALRSNKKDAQPGDLVVFNWGDGGKLEDHIGFVEKNYGSYIQTIEGNTTSGNAGSQGNGGGVYRRTRNWGVVYGIIKVPYSNKRNMSEAAIADIPNQTYTGKAITPALKSGAGATFTTSYKDNVNIGYGTATATGTGNWQGSVSKSFKILPSELVKYNDIDPYGWYVNTLAEAVKLGYIKGCPSGAMDPLANMTRAQAVCMIANAAGFNEEQLPFDDVAKPVWYYDAAKWAVKNEVITDEFNTMRPEDGCTRAEFVTMLHNWAGKPEATKEPEGFEDYKDTPDFAKPGMSWCVENGIVNGNEGKLYPNNVCLRAEAAAMLVNKKHAEEE